MNSQGVITIKIVPNFSKGCVQMSDSNVKFITLHYSSYIYNLSMIAPVDRRCAGGRDVLNFLNFSPLPVIG